MGPQNRLELWPLRPGEALLPLTAVTGGEPQGEGGRRESDCPTLSRRLRAALSRHHLIWVVSAKVKNQGVPVFYNVPF